MCHSDCLHLVASPFQRSTWCWWFCSAPANTCHGISHEMQPLRCAVFSLRHCRDALFLQGRTSIRGSHTKPSLRAVSMVSSSTRARTNSPGHFEKIREACAAVQQVLFLLTRNKETSCINVYYMHLPVPTSLHLSFPVISCSWDIGVLHSALPTTVLVREPLMAGKWSFAHEATTSSLLMFFIF